MDGKGSNPGDVAEEVEGHVAHHHNHQKGDPNAKTFPNRPGPRQYPHSNSALLFESVDQTADDDAHFQHHG